MIGLLKNMQMDSNEDKKFADPEIEPKMQKPALGAGFSVFNLRTGRDSNPRPPP